MTMRGMAPEDILRMEQEQEMQKLCDWCSKPIDRKGGDGGLLIQADSLCHKCLIVLNKEAEKQGLKRG